MDFSLTQKKLNALMKGKPIQLKYSDLTSTQPNTRVESIEHKTMAKIKRAINENRGVRIQLTPQEIESVRTSLKGGKVSVGKVFKDIGKKIVSTAKKVGSELKPLARPAIKGLVDVGVAGLSSLAGSPELAPLFSSVANTGVDSALDKANIGIGVKGSKEMRDKMARLRSMRKVGSGMDVSSVMLEDGKSVKVIRGYGVGKKDYNMVKQSLVEHFLPHSPTMSHAKSLASKVMTNGGAILEQPVYYLGGKLSMKKLGRTIISGAKKLWEKAKPVVKHFAEKGLALATEGAKALASEYGVPEEVTEKLVDYGEKKATRALDKYITKDASQSPEMASQKFIGDSGEYARSKGHEAISRYIPAELQDVARKQLEEKVGSAEDIAAQRLYGGRVMTAIRDDRGHLLSHFHPATTPFIPPPNLPQGQIGVGGSFRGYGGSFCC